MKDQPNRVDVSHSLSHAGGKLKEIKDELGRARALRQIKKHLQALSE